MFAVAIFGMATISSIGIMNQGLYNAQSTLEVSMARNEISAQADALRFIHNAYISENRASGAYTQVWEKIVSLASLTYGDSNLSSFLNEYTENDYCSDIYTNNAVQPQSFTINLRRLDNATVTSAVNSSTLQNIIISSSLHSSGSLSPTSTYPRLIYSGSTDSTLSDTVADLTTTSRSSEFDHTSISRAEGVWVTAVASNIFTGSLGGHQPQFYDFYIRTCWDSPKSTASNKISTIIRLYNPKY